MFWGLVLEPSKKYTQKVDQTFHISQAALDLKSCDGNEFIQVVVEYENSSFILATLSKKANIFQVPLDLIFKTGDQVSFRTIGNGKVHLSGYHVLEDLDSMIMNGEEESDLEDVIEEVKGKGKRKKLTQNSKGGKKARLDNFNEDGTDDDELDEEDSEDDDDDEEEEKVVGNKNKKKNQKSDSSFASLDDDDEDVEDEEEDEDDEDDEFDEEEDDDDDDEDIEMDDDDDEDMDNTDDEDEEENEAKAKTPKSDKKKSPGTPNGLPSTKGKDKSSQGGNKNTQQVTPGKEKKTPKSETKQKGEKNQKNAESTPQKKNEDKSQKSPKGEGSPQKRVLEGGVVSEELKVGNGPVAKPGKMVNVYYVGCLASSKKPFDSVQNGSGFKFRVGRNEVIKGWDIGIIGMKVGGKRRLTIPAHLAYGSKGSPPVIPPNSTLVFTIELRGLS